MGEFYFYFLFFIFLLLGACIGSFVNVIIYRLPIILLNKSKKIKNEDSLSLSLPCSHCFSCKNKILKRDNIPVLSWILLRGECRFCKVKISVFYPLTELFFCLYFVFCYFLLSDNYSIFYISSFLLLSTLLYCIFIIDFNYFLVPNLLSNFLIISGLYFSFLSDSKITPHESTLGIITAFSIVYLVGFIFKKYKGQEYIGYGDYKLFSGAGAWCGILNIDMIFILSSAFGVLFYFSSFVKYNIDEKIYMDDVRELNKRVIPFGPSICLSTYFCFLLSNFL